MKKIILILGIFCLCCGASGCAIIQPFSRVEATAGVQALPPYSGPKARIAVSDFEIKAAKASGKIGSGLREMLVAALIDSNRFSVVERQDLDAVKKEQESSASVTTDTETNIEKGKIMTADLILAAVVTDFEPQASGGRAGVGGGGQMGSGLFGGLLRGSLNKAHLALDIRLMDASRSEIITATGVEAQASDISGAIMTGFLRGYGLGSGLSAYSNTPMEKAIRICIIKVVKYIAENTSADYYKY